MMLLDPTLTLSYALLAIVLAVTPGPDMMFVIANGVRHGLGGAIAAAFSGAAGTTIHAIIAAFGIAALLAATPGAFETLSIAGVLYLMFLGLQAVRSAFTHSGSDAALSTAQTSKTVVFRNGLVTNLLRFLIPWFDGVILSQDWKEALWDKFVTAAPRPRTPSELQYSDRRLRSRT
jgi:threonine/homoserine/homoserine lactone efflux protein